MGHTAKHTTTPREHNYMQVSYAVKHTHTLVAPPLSPPDHYCGQTYACYKQKKTKIYRYWQKRCRYWQTKLNENTQHSDEKYISALVAAFHRRFQHSQIELPTSYRRAHLPMYRPLVIVLQSRARHLAISYVRSHACGAETDDFVPSQQCDEFFLSSLGPPTA